MKRLTKYYYVAFFLLFSILFGEAGLGRNVVVGQERPLRYVDIIIALNSKVPNKDYKNRDEVIAYLKSQIKKRKVEKPLTEERIIDLQQAGAKSDLIELIRQNSPPIPTPPIPNKEKVEVKPDESMFSSSKALINWQRYKVSGKNVSLNFPKLPTKMTSSNPCGNTDSETFAAYAKGRAYIFTLYSKNENPIPSYCPDKKVFSEKSFPAYLDGVAKNNGKKEISDKVNYGGQTIYRFSSGNSNFWIVNDFQNKSWYEFKVVGENDENTLNNFVGSLEISSNKTAIEISAGADATIGDEGYDSEKANSTETAGLLILHKPRASYTDAARQSQVQGTVTLRVVFHASGAISNVIPVSGLPNGLTEQAIIAAKRLIFKPATLNGKNATVTKQVQYSFTLY